MGVGYVVVIINKSSGAEVVVQGMRTGLGDHHILVQTGRGQGRTFVGVGQVRQMRIGCLSFSSSPEWGGEEMQLGSS